MNQISSKILGPLLIFLALFPATHPAEEANDILKRRDMTYRISTTWDGLPVDHEEVTVTLSGKGDEGVEIKVLAPFFGLPGNPGGEPGKPFDKLWNYEVVEVFFADGDAEKPKYLEVELCPWGQHLVLILDGVRNAVRTLLPIEFHSKIENGYWHGTALIPASYFPPRVTRFNAYAIHDVEVSDGSDPRRYESLFPVPNGKYPSADFHRLDYFQPIDFGSILPGNVNATLSDPWPQGTSSQSEQDVQYETEIENATVISVSVAANKRLFGGEVPTQSAANMIINGVSTEKTAQINIELSAIFHDVPTKPTGTPEEPLPDKDLDKMETLRVYISNQARRVLELVFSPFGQYNVKFYRQPYVLISKGNRINQLEVAVNTTTKTWTVKAELPLYYLPANMYYYNLASVYPLNGTVQYETLYSVKNVGISIPDLMVLKLYSTKTIIEPMLNEGYSTIWEENE